MADQDEDVPDETCVDYPADLFDLTCSIEMSLENVEQLPPNFAVTVTGTTSGPGDYPEPSGDTALA